MNQLNQDTYNLLTKANQEVSRKFNKDGVLGWYKLTYNLFTSSPIETIDDFWKIVAYTYSWMPTIPKVSVHLIKDTDKLVNDLQALKKGDVSNLVEQFKELIPVINNSLVGTSKVLHFISPNYVPIIDRNVLRGWRLFFKDYSEYGVYLLPSYHSSLNETHIPDYMMYRDTMVEWVANCGGQFTMRDLEFGFFELGKNSPKEQVDHSKTII